MNKVVLGTDSRDKLKKGIDTLADAVKVSLGPNGRNVVITKDMEGVMSTKDGVTIAKSIKKLEDPIEDMGAQIVKQASEKTATMAGDGTTTSTVLAQALINEGLKYVAKGYNPVELKRGIDVGVKEIISELRSFSDPISDESQLKSVATISANNDEEVGNLIATAMENVGKEGVITVEESKTGETILETVEGMQLDKGYKSPFFTTDNNTMQAVLEEPKVLILNQKITQVKSLLPILEHVSKSGKQLLIVAEDIDGEALATLIVNKMRGTLKSVAVKAPEFGDRRLETMEDLAVLVGGKVVDIQKGMRLDKFEAEWLGDCRRVVVSKNDTTIIDGNGEETALEQRLEEIKARIEGENSSPYEKQKLQERLAKLVGGVAVIKVGANTELELKEKKDRVDDALHATKAAVEEGILPGGGTALLKAKKALSKKKDGFERGRAIVRKAVSKPFEQILTNAGVENIEEIMPKLSRTKNVWTGYNIELGDNDDFFAQGIIDPTKVVRLALENAASIAGTLLLTDAVVYTEKSDDEEEGMPGMPGMF